MLKIESDVCPLYHISSYLPESFGSALRLFALKNRTKAELVTEVRLRCHGAFSLSCSDENIFPDMNGEISQKPLICSEEDIRTCVFRLCESSYHAHEEEIKNGYISMKNGFRAGIAPRCSHTDAVYGVSSVNIRIPKEIKGCSDALTKITGARSTLIYAPPGVGKTTVLKDIIRYVSGMGLRCAVIDSRGELDVSAVLCDRISGTEKSKGIEIAQRTLCPQYTVCDEIGADDVDSIIQVSNAGVPFTATCHGASFEEIMRRPFVKKLYDAKVFDFYARLFRNGSTVTFDIKECS
ncbi:MAG: hypothetical protein IKL21_02655 [Clostridia bacterium]|nr:hypothetical protein [Clostridia bacterium]